MGMGRIELELLINEHAYRPFTGEILAVGRQHIGPSGPAILDILKRHGVPAINTDFEVDHLNTHQKPGETTVLDTSFFRSFTDAKYSVADINPYEGADHIFDICGEVPADLVNRFDLIIDGGSLDNVFDPVKMVSNMSKMLRPGGRMFVYAWSNSFATAYVKITPDWIMDFCAVNEYADCKVYVSRHEQPGGDASLGQSIELFHYDPLIETNSGPVYEGAFVGKAGHSSTYCIAEKGEASTNDRTAVQKHYRGKDGTQPYLTSAIRFHASRRPIFSLPGQTVPDLAPISDMQTVRPVALFGTPANYTAEFVILRKLDHLLTAQKLSEKRIETNREIFETIVRRMQDDIHRTQTAISVNVHQSGEKISTQLYELGLRLGDTSAPATCDAPLRPSLARRVIGRIRRALAA